MGDMDAMEIDSSRKDKMASSAAAATGAADTVAAGGGLPSAAGVQGSRPLTAQVSTPLIAVHRWICSTCVLLCRPCNSCSYLAVSSDQAAVYVLHLEDVSQSQCCMLLAAQPVSISYRCRSKEKPIHGSCRCQWHSGTGEGPLVTVGICSITWRDWQ